MKKEIVFILIIIIILLIITFLNFSVISKTEKEKNTSLEVIECLKDSDCIIIRASCCSCEEGGSQRCVPKADLSYHVKLLERCYTSGICIENNCDKVTCSCINNKCTGKKI